MNKTKIFAFVLGLFCCMQVSAQEWNASLFGIKSNGTTLNTTSIQKAIDWISEQGGGTLQFYVGRYLTGTIYLKDNVTINLNEGAILVGSTNPYDYDFTRNDRALVTAYNAKNIAVTGKGVIDGQGRQLAYNVLDQAQKGLIKDQMSYDRPANRGKAVYLRECDNVLLQGINIRNAGDWVLVPDQCTNITLDGLTIDSKAFWNNDGIDIVDCKDMVIKNCFVDSTDDAICFKSHDAKTRCENILVTNCTARSSASGFKFGTVTAGGYKNIRIINNKVYNTHRSAITIATPDGGHIEDILVDSLYAYNTSNAIYLRIGRRWMGDRPMGSMKNITIQNLYCEIPAEKADVGYDYEGPVEDLPRNTSPASIVGLEGGYDIENVTLRNIEIVYPGGGNPNYAYRGTKPADLDSIPEMPAAYPEFSQFKELPAWGFWVRHAKNVTFDNVTLTAEKRDYRPAIVLQEVDGVTLENMTYNEPGGKKKQVVTYKATNVAQKK